MKGLPCAARPAPAGGRRRLGPDLEAYLTAGVALAVSLLGVAGVVDTGVVSAATLGILALVSFELANSHRRSRRAEPDVRQLTTTVAVPLAQSMDTIVPSAEPGAGPGLAQARDIWLVGVTLSRTIRSQLPALEHCLATGGSVRVVIIDPTGPAAGEAARRNGLREKAGVFEHRVRPTVDLLRHLARQPDASGTLQVRLARFVPSFGLTMVDPDTVAGRATVEVYSHRPGGGEPLLELTAARDPRWYRHFRAEFEHVWERARPAPDGDGVT